jgi:chromosome segregation ATPase
MASSNSPRRIQAATSTGIPRKPSYNKLKLAASERAHDGGNNHLDGIPTRENTLNVSSTNSSFQPPNTSTDPGGGGSNSTNDPSLTATEANLSNGWDNSVGKAGLGKTGRVINRLVSDNEALKRDIQIERLRAEESRQTARLLEDKLERVISDYESRLLEANVTKTLLARKERQVETLQDAVELERQRAVDAAARERVWKDEMDAARTDAKRQVEDATNYAALCEGRYNAISSHWRDQGEEVKRTVTKMKKEVDGLVVERKKDDGKIETLRELCDQQDGNIRELRRQKEEIEAQFERYKREQEEGLKDIKRKADGREREQERTLQEAREVLDKLRWALNVKEKIEWAQ